MKSYKAFIIFIACAVCLFSNTAFAKNLSQWPPVVGKSYPDLELVDQTGTKVRLSSFKGKVMIVEPVGMNCAACLAFSGAHEKGGYQNFSPQKDLDSFENYLRQYAPSVSMQGNDIVFIQLLLYSPSMKTPDLPEVQAWAKHFGFETSKNQYVLQGTPEMINDASYAMIPGFQLIDRQFILRSDSTGHAPKHDLYRHLIPMIPKLVSEA